MSIFRNQKKVSKQKNNSSNKKPMESSSGQISIIPKPELRGFWGSSLIKPPFRVTSADVVIICPEPLFWGNQWVPLALIIRPAISGGGIQAFLQRKNSGWTNNAWLQPGNMHTSHVDASGFRQDKSVTLTKKVHK